MIKNKQLIVLITAIGLLLFSQVISFLVNKSMQQNLDQSMQVFEPQVAAIVPQSESIVSLMPSSWVEEKTEPRLTPADPSDYGFIVYSEDTKPKTEEEWGILIRGALASSELSLREEKKKVMGTAKVSLAEYNERMQQIDEQVEILKQRLQDNPEEQEAREYLENLGILKALSKAIKYDVVSQ